MFIEQTNHWVAQRKSQHERGTINLCARYNNKSPVYTTKLSQGIAKIQVQIAPVLKLTKSGEIPYRLMLYKRIYLPITDPLGHNTNKGTSANSY